MNNNYSQIPAAAPDAEARALKILHERLWHFTSIGMGNCRAAQRVRREIECRRALNSSTHKLPNSQTLSQTALANQTFEQLTAGLSHLETVGLANSRAAQITRRELSRQLLIQSALLLANANFNPAEPRDRRGRWTQGGDTAPAAASKPEQRITRLAMEAPASGHGAAAINDPNQYLRNVSDSFANTPNAATNSPAQTNAATKPNDWLPDNGKPDAVELSTLQGIGSLLDLAGKGVWNLVSAGTFEDIGDTEDALKQLGFSSDQLKKWGFKNVEEDSGTTGEKPIDQGIQSLPPAERALSRAGQGVVESTPRLAIAAADPALGAVAFGARPEGFDVKQAVLAAALPLVGKYSGEISEAIAARAGVSSEAALQAFNKMGGAAGVTSAMGADQLAQIMKLPPEQRKDALIEAAAAIVAGLLFAGISGAGKRDSLGKWVDENGGGLSETDNIQRGQNAMDRSIRNKMDVQKAMYRKGVGQIDFIWGRPGTNQPDVNGRTHADGYGISHVLAKHGEEAVRNLPEVLAKGKISPHEVEGRLYVTYGNYRVVLEHENGKKAFVVTGFDETK